MFNSGLIVIIFLFSLISSKLYCIIKKLDIRAIFTHTVDPDTVLKIECLIMMETGKSPHHVILEDNLSHDSLYQMSNIEYPYVNND